MPRKKLSPSPIDQIEKDFLDALRRLQDGVPTNKDLKAAKTHGRLKINTSSVAKEAGRSRTLIALENCRYPRVREAVRLAQVGAPCEPRTSTDLIDKLRADITELRVQLKKAEAHSVLHFKAREKAEREAVRWKSAHDRLLKKQPSSDVTVIPFPPRS